MCVPGMHYPLQSLDMWSETIPVVYIVNDGHMMQVVVLHDDRVELREGRKGALRWTWTGDDDTQLLQLSESAGDIFVATRSSKGCHPSCILLCLSPACISRMLRRSAG